MSESTTSKQYLAIISSKGTLDWKRCILCQEQSDRKGTLVQTPRTESYQKLLDAVEERASLQDGPYVDIQNYLEQFSKDTLIERKPMWHRVCYSAATNTVSIQRARDRLEHAMSTGS